MASLENVLAVILGGGRGSRLYPLTKMRSKPAVPIAGKYRLIDIPISNCINSGIYRVAVLTQFNSVSLHRHISRTYQFDTFHIGWVQIWAAEQTVQSETWYQGTADAVRKQLFEIRATRAKQVLILAGDHLYRMDYAKMAQFHWDNQADITVAVQPVPTAETGRFGILKKNAENQIVDFAEKPKDPARLQTLVSRSDAGRPFLGSMGIYLFNTDALIDLVENTQFDDFGSHVIPNAIGKYNVMGYDFDDYWEDIGTIRSFYDTNLALATPNPPFNFFDEDQPIYTNPRYLPGTIVENSLLEHVLMAEGGCIKDAEVRHAIIGLRSQIRSGVRVLNSIVMGADYYDANSCQNSPEIGPVPIGIGEDSLIDGAIIDKNARIGRGVTIRPFPVGTEYDDPQKHYFVRDGIVVIPKNEQIAPGTYIGPEGQ